MARQDFEDDAHYDDAGHYGEHHQDLGELVMEKAPAWAISFAVHMIMILVFSQVMWRAPREMTPEVEAAIEQIQEEIEEPVIEENIEIEEEVEIDEEEPIDETIDEYSDVDVDFNEPPGDPDDPTDKMPLAIPRLALGTGGAARYLPGQFGHRGGRGRRRSLRRGGGNRASEKAVRDGLWWLAKVQIKEGPRKGSWDCDRWGGSDQKGDVAVTGLALLAFLGAGHSDQEGDFQENITMACQFLSREIGANGRFKETRLYGQGISTMALSEAYGMGRTPWVGKAAQSALDYLIKTQPDTGGYGYEGEGEDTSISGWCFMALKSGRICGLDVPDSAFEKMRRFMTDIYREDGTSVYRTSNRDFGTEATTAIALFCRIFLGWEKEDAMVAKAAEAVDRHGVHLENLYYNYYATLSMFQMGGDMWTKWNKNFRDPILAKQEGKDNEELSGSWPTDTAWAAQGGRVYTTAMAILSLEVYYRFLPIYRSE